jgi:hypothetical protein
VSNPQFCPDLWSPVVAAGPQSALSGVLAGFVFTGIVVVLSTSPDPNSQPHERAQYRRYALQLLASAFIIFALDSYFTPITAGELACNRAKAETVLTGGTLGTGALMLLAGLGWLLVTYSEEVGEIRDILRAMILGIWFVIIVMLAISGQAVGQALLYKRNQDYVDTIPYLLALLVAATIAIRARRSMVLAKGEPDVYAKFLTGSVKNAALIALIGAIVSATLTGVAAGFSGTWWITPPSWAVYLIVLLAILVPGIVIIVGVPATIGAVNQRLPQIASKNPG